MNHWDSIYESGAYKRQWDYKYPSQELVATVATLGVAEAVMALDLGCGAGRDAIFLAQCGFKVIGVDISQKAIDIAQERAAEAGIIVDWRCGSALELPVADESLDFISDRGCFHLISENEREQYSLEIARVLKTDGTFLLRGFGSKHAHGVGKVTKEQIEKFFPDTKFAKGPFLPLAMVADAGELEGNIVVMKRK